MSRAPKLLAGALLATALCLPFAAAPAAADPTPVAVSTMTVDFSAAVSSGTLVLLPPADPDGTEGKKGGKWRGGAAFNTDTEKWMATAGNRHMTLAWGSYDTKEEAQAEGNAQAAFNNQNSVMAGPGCTPFVLC